MFSSVELWNRLIFRIPGVGLRRGRGRNRLEEAGRGSLVGRRDGWIKRELVLKKFIMLVCNRFHSLSNYLLIKLKIRWDSISILYFDNDVKIYVIITKVDSSLTVHSSYNYKPKPDYFVCILELPELKNI